jgi:SAM-dependent methyltransferase
VTTSTPESRYLHGTHSEEQQRLALLNQILNDACLVELRLRGGERILDVGSGLGQFSRAMARAAGPSGKVTGIERSAEQISKALQYASEDGESGLIEIRQGDAKALPLARQEWESFDVVHTRFLLEHLPDPMIVVREMARAARSGGRVVLADDDHEVLRLNPEPEGFRALWAAYMGAFEKLGNDPCVGRRLVSMLAEAGVCPARAVWVPFGTCAGDARFPAFAANMIGVIDGAGAQIVEHGLMKRNEFDAAMDRMRAWSNQPDAVLWYGVCWAEGVKP